MGLYSALMTIEQREFFGVLHLPGHVTSVFNGQLQGPVAATPIDQRIAVELSLPVLTTKPVAVVIQTPNLPHENRMVLHLYK